MFFFYVFCRLFIFSSLSVFFPFSSSGRVARASFLLLSDVEPWPVVDRAHLTFFSLCRDFSVMPTGSSRVALRCVGFGFGLCLQLQRTTQRLRSTFSRKSAYVILLFFFSSAYCSSYWLSTASRIRQTVIRMRHHSETGRMAQQCMAL